MITYPEQSTGLLPTGAISAAAWDAGLEKGSQSLPTALIWKNPYMTDEQNVERLVAHAKFAAAHYPNVHAVGFADDDCDWSSSADE